MGNSHGPERKKELKVRTKNIQWVLRWPRRRWEQVLGSEQSLKGEGLGF